MIKSLLVSLMVVCGFAVAQAADCGYGSVSKTVTCEVVISYMVDGEGIEYPIEYPTKFPLDVHTVTLGGRYINSQTFSSKSISGQMTFSPLEGGVLNVTFSKPVSELGSGYSVPVNFPETCNGEKAQATRSGKFSVNEGTYTAEYVIDVNCVATTQFSRD